MRLSPGHLACSDNLSDRNRQVWNPIAYLPNSVVRLSAASRKAAVSMALSLLAFTGTSTKDFLSVSNQVPPKGYVAFAAIIAVAAGFSVSARSTNVILEISAEIELARAAGPERRECSSLENTARCKGCTYTGGEMSAGFFYILIWAGSVLTLSLTSYLHIYWLLSDFPPNFSLSKYSFDVFFIFPVTTNLFSLFPNCPREKEKIKSLLSIFVISS